MGRAICKGIKYLVNKRTKKPIEQYERLGECPSDSRESAPAEKPVSLRPLKFEEAVKGLLRTKTGKKDPAET
jgi:hypothetical protein